MSVLVVMPPTRFATGDSKHCSKRVAPTLQTVFQATVGAFSNPITNTQLLTRFRCRPFLGSNTKSPPTSSPCETRRQSSRFRLPKVPWRTVFRWSTPSCGHYVIRKWSSQGVPGFWANLSSASCKLPKNQYLSGEPIAEPRFQLDGADECPKNTLIRSLGLYPRQSR